MWRTLRTAAAVLVCLGVLVAINISTRDRHDYRWYSGAMGQLIVTPMFDVEVHESIVVKGVNSGYTSLTTDHVFVVVSWSASAKGRIARLGSADVTLATRDGHLVRQRGNFASTSNLPDAEAGFTSSGFSVFELPEDRVDGASLEIRDAQGAMVTYSGAVRVTGIVTPETRRANAVELPKGSVEATR